MTPPVVIRDATLSDWDFIRKAWRATFLIGGPAVHGAEKQHYFDEMTRVFAAICPTASARIACDPADEDNDLAFVVYSGPVIYFIYVLQEFRRNGIVPLLLDGLNVARYAFKTIQGERRLKPATRGWQYAPRFTYGEAN